MIESASFLAALVIGFLGGVHCVGMCGSIVGAMSFNIGPQTHNKIVVLNLAYNIGRIASYMIAGLLAGGLGFLLVAGSYEPQIKTTLHIFANLILLALGLYLAKFWSGIVYLERAGNYIWKLIAPLAGKFFPFTNISQGFIAGILWGWLPCGLVYSVLIWAAASSSPLAGAWYMLGFGIGTLPNLLALGLFVDRLKTYLQKKALRVGAGMLLVIYAIYKLFKLLIA